MQGALCSVAPVCLDDPSPLSPASTVPFLLLWSFLSSLPSAPHPVRAVKRVGSTAGVAKAQSSAPQTPTTQSRAPSSRRSSLRDGEGCGGREGLRICPRAPLHSHSKGAGLPGQGQQDHTKAPTTGCAGLPPAPLVLTPLAIKMQHAPQPSQSGIQLPHSPLSHRPDSTIREMAFLASALAAQGTQLGD